MTAPAMRFRRRRAVARWWSRSPSLTAATEVPRPGPCSTAMVPISTATGSFLPPKTERSPAGTRPSASGELVSKSIARRLVWERSTRDWRLDLLVRRISFMPRISGLERSTFSTAIFSQRRSQGPSPTRPSPPCSRPLGFRTLAGRCLSLTRCRTPRSMMTSRGLALAPSSFGNFHNDVLVGNFGDGRINAFAADGSFRGQLKSETNAPIQIDGLWGLRFGNGALGASTNTLYFAAGINDEQDGLFGSIVNVDN